MKLIAWCRGERVALAGGRVHPELAGPGLEDQPVEVAGAGVDVREAEHVAEEGPGRVGVVGVDQRVAGEDHPVSLPRALR